jgi:sporulation-control protein spo0M
LHVFVDGENKGAVTMSFFKKIKNGLGIGTIKFEIVVPSHVQGDSGQLAGNIVITAKGDHLVKDVEVTLDRVHTWDERESVYNTTTDRYEDRWNSRSHSVTLGHFMDQAPFEIATDETKNIPFIIQFQPIDPQFASSTNGVMWDFMDSMFSARSHIRNERVHYSVHGDADLEDVAFDKGDQKVVVIM